MSCISTLQSCCILKPCIVSCKMQSCSSILSTHNHSLTFFFMFPLSSHSCHSLPSLTFFLSPAPLAAIVLWTALMLPPVTGIMCYSTHCPNGKSVCQENCPASFHFCAAFYNQKPSGGLEIALLGCLDDSVGEMVPANCAISSIGQGQVGCFCNTSLCNHIGVPVSNTSTTSSTMSTMSTPARVRPEKPTGLGPSEYECLYMCVCACACACAYVCACACVCICMCMCTCMYIMCVDYIFVYVRCVCTHVGVCAHM